MIPVLSFKTDEENGEIRIHAGGHHVATVLVDAAQADDYDSNDEGLDVMIDVIEYAGWFNDNSYVSIQTHSVNAGIDRARG